MIKTALTRTSVYKYGIPECFHYHDGPTYVGAVWTEDWQTWKVYATSPYMYGPLGEFPSLEAAEIHLERRYNESFYGEDM